MVREKTLVIIKPDGVNRSLIGEVIKRFERKGLKVVGMKMERLSPEIMGEHYFHHKGKPFVEGLINFMTAIPSVLLVLEGKEAISVVRKLAGPTNGRDAELGTIRGDYSISTQSNVIHASENKDAANVEIDRFFKKTELWDYDKMDFNWIYSDNEKSPLK